MKKLPPPPSHCPADADICETIQQAGLVYVSDEMPGFSRVRSGKRFIYRDAAGHDLKDETIRQRIASIVIPPAWEDVWISPWENGHIQATGRDIKGRKQYRYHPEWSRVRNETKYWRMIEFGNALPKIREQVDSDLRRRGLPREKVLATVVRLLELTHVRVGNEEYVQENDSYGLTTLRSRHVTCNTNGCQLKFRGKSGQEHEIAFRDKRLARIVRECHELPGQELFQYVDDDGNVQKITSGDVNQYIRAIAGDDFTAKDFRTWWGTVVAAEAFLGFGSQQGKTRIKKCIVDAVKRASGSLGNRPATCRKYYVHPAIIDGFTNGVLGNELGREMKKAMKNCRGGLEPLECALIAFLKNSAPSQNQVRRTIKGRNSSLPTGRAAAKPSIPSQEKAAR